jgi:hypothetical protein
MPVPAHSGASRPKGMRRESRAGRFLRRAVQWDDRRYPGFFETGWSGLRRTNRAGAVHLTRRPTDGRAGYLVMLLALWRDWAACPRESQRMGGTQHSCPLQKG